MMLVTVNRIPNINGVTLSTCFVDQRFMCFGIEDQQGVMKIPGKTAIYEGVYKLGVRTFGGWHDRFSKAHPLSHKGMLEIKNVPHFTDVLIHPGNTVEDTEACYLPNFGLTYDPNIDSRPKGINSNRAYWHLYNAVIESAKRGEAEIKFQTLQVPGAANPFPYLTLDEEHF